MILIFSKNYDIVYNSYTDVKTHLKSNFKFFFEKNVHFEVGFFFVIKWPEKKILKRKKIRPQNGHFFRKKN